MAKLKLIVSMSIFGTIGIFVRFINLPSSLIALFRGITATLFLWLIVLIKKDKISFESIKENLLLLILSGTAIGTNWILLFESYRYTTVAVATLCYYLAPVFVIIASPFILKEKLNAKKIICVIMALIGMVFVSGILDNTSLSNIGFKGILYGIGAALFYASVILINKFFRNISSYDLTIMQLLVASIILTPYNLLTIDVASVSFDVAKVLLLMVVGIIHTGFSYQMYFSSLKELNAQTVAILSYIDPALAIILSIFILNEGMNVLSLFGAFLVLGSTLVSEINFDKK